MNGRLVGIARQCVLYERQLIVDLVDELVDVDAPAEGAIHLLVDVLVADAGARLHVDEAVKVAGGARPRAMLARVEEGVQELEQLAHTLLARRYARHVRREERHVHVELLDGLEAALTPRLHWRSFTSNNQIF